MKIRHILPILCLPLLASCGGNGSDNGKSMADYKDATAADSMIFYFGQLRAADYWREAQADTTLATRESRDEFLRGLRAGMDAVRDKDAYNQGVYVGIQLAMNMKEMQEGYDIKFNRDILFDAISDGLRNDSAVDMSEATKEYTRLINDLNQQKEERDRAKGREALAAEAKALKMTKINDDLYAAAPTKPGTGDVVKLGDNVSVVMDIAVVGGEMIDNQATPSLKVGSRLVGPVTEALLTMRPGETREFLTTPPALMGRMYLRRGLNANDILKLTITVGHGSEQPEAEAASIPVQAPVQAIKPADAK